MCYIFLRAQNSPDFMWLFYGNGAYVSCVLNTIHLKQILSRNHLIIKVIAK